MALQDENTTISIREKVADLAAEIPDGAYVVWIKSVNRDWRYGYGAATLRATPGFQPVAELSDGAVFRMNRAYVPRGNPYRDAYERIAAEDYGAPAARGVFTMYVGEDALVYLKKPCAAADVETDAKFFSAHLPGRRRGLESRGQASRL